MKKKVLNNFDYEQILLGDLEAENVDNEILNKLKMSNKSILEQYPPDLMAEKIRKKLDKNSEKIHKNNFYKKRYIPLSAAAVFLLFFIMLPLLKQADIQEIRQENEVIRLKGNEPSLFIYRGNSDDAEPELLGNNSLVKEKDLLQISYDSAGSKYGVIFSIDGRGTVTLHFPDNVYSNTRLNFGGKVFLPFSYELDNAPFFERFFFVTSDIEIDAADIMEKAGKIAKGNKSELLILPQEYTQESTILFKEEAK